MPLHKNTILLWEAGSGYQNRYNIAYCNQSSRLAVQLQMYIVDLQLNSNSTPLTAICLENVDSIYILPLCMQMMTPDFYYI